MFTRGAIVRTGLAPMPVMIRITVRDDDMGSGRPLFLRDQTSEVQDPEILAGIDDNCCLTLFDQKCVVQVMSNFHCHYPESLFSAIAEIRQLWVVLRAVS